VKRQRIVAYALRRNLFGLPLILGVTCSAVVILLANPAFTIAHSQGDYDLASPRRRVEGLVRDEIAKIQTGSLTSQDDTVSRNMTNSNGPTLVKTHTNYHSWNQTNITTSWNYNDQSSNTTNSTSKEPISTEDDGGRDKSNGEKTNSVETWSNSSSETQRNYLSSQNGGDKMNQSSSSREDNIILDIESRNSSISNDNSQVTVRQQTKISHATNSSQEDALRSSSQSVDSLIEKGINSTRDSSHTVNITKSNESNSSTEGWQDGNDSTVLHSTDANTDSGDPEDPQVTPDISSQTVLVESTPMNSKTEQVGSPEVETRDSHEVMTPSWQEYEPTVMTPAWLSPQGEDDENQVVKPIWRSEDVKKSGKDTASALQTSTDNLKGPTFAEPTLYETVDSSTGKTVSESVVISKSSTDHPVMQAPWIQPSGDSSNSQVMAPPWTVQDGDVSGASVQGVADPVWVSEGHGNNSYYANDGGFLMSSQLPPDRQIVQGSSMSEKEDSSNTQLMTPTWTSRTGYPGDESLSLPVTDPVWSGEQNSHEGSRESYSFSHSAVSDFQSVPREGWSGATGDGNEESSSNQYGSVRGESSSSGQSGGGYRLSGVAYGRLPNLLSWSANTDEIWNTWGRSRKGRNAPKRSKGCPGWDSLHSRKSSKLKKKEKCGGQKCKFSWLCRN
jgi:hypothetical protein